MVARSARSTSPRDLVETAVRAHVRPGGFSRSIKVWLPNRSKASGQSSTYEFSYTVEEGAPVAVGTRVLSKDTTQFASYTFYDGFLRRRQTQAAGPDNGRLLTDAF